ncbi:type IV pilus assembly protein FimV [Luteimonas saliphila]|uniref:type IV pilus assembly protein FimV n=1 Tax=Luteimonas saliphila TaxID=2804919 RepID=UPI00192DA6AF|nr:FimV/HubP family polar landmark protein [Luteimonas saliphila]
MQTPRRTKPTARGRSWALAFGLLLALLAWPVFALGLGQIEVKSRAGEPLLAEIPIISADPSELENLQARLASPDTFRRIGLEPPTGLVSGLRFAVALDAQGRPVIRITSDVPVQQPMLTFLVEVDWGQGRLVREYSALVDTPQTVAAPAQPPIQAPQAAPSNVIARPAEVATTEPRPAADAASEEPAAAEPDETQAVAAEAPPPAPVPPPAATPPAAVSGVPGEYGPVQRGRTLGEIAASLSTGSGHSLNQVMLALLRANPEAFIGGNVNLVRQGAVLRVPPSDTWSDTSIAEANAMVREHVSRWREMRRPVVQPEAVAEAGGEGAAPTTGERAPAATTQGAGRVAEARLEIVPPSSGGGQDAGTRTGTAAGGEGDMLQQQELVQTRETLAARDAEVQELKTRLAELEQLQQQQQQLIQMKDSELAAAQQRLAQSNAEPAATTTQAESGTPPAQAGAGLPWLWIGMGLVAAALLVAWLVSRRKGQARERKPSYGFASAASKPPVKSETAVPVAVPAPEPEPEPEPMVAAAPAPGDLGSTTWQAAPAAATGTSPTWHAAGDEGARGAAVAPLNPAPAGQERIELARAYIDLGDTDTARSLLQEVADFGDAGARGEAQRLLRELV